MLVSSPTDNNSNSQGSEGQGSPYLLLPVTVLLTTKKNRAGWKNSAKINTETSN